jgi:hypothetical protein
VLSRLGASGAILSSLIEIMLAAPIVYKSQETGRKDLRLIAHDRPITNLISLD